MPRRYNRAGRHLGTRKVYLTFQDISDETGIPYPRLVRHFKRYKEQIPFRRRLGVQLFPRQSVAVFKKLEEGQKKAARDKVHVVKRASSQDIKRAIGVRKDEDRRVQRTLEELGVSLDGQRLAK